MSEEKKPEKKSIPPLKLPEFKKAFPASDKNIRGADAKKNVSRRAGRRAAADE